MKTRFTIASISLLMLMSIAYYAYSDIMESYTIVFTGDSEGFDCVPDLNIQFNGVGKISTSDQLFTTVDPSNGTFELQREPHNFVINGVSLMQSGHLHWNSEYIGCYCCNNLDVFCYTIGINTQTRQMFITVTHQPGESCENTDPGEDPDEN